MADHGVIVLGIGVGRYAVPLSAIEEVGRLPPVTRLPGVPSWLLGVANWRGRVLAVVDLRAELGEPPVPATRRTRVVVLRAAGVTVGLVADSVSGLRPSAEVGPVPPELAPGGARLLAGVSTGGDDDAPVALLDVAAVLGLRRTLPSPRTPAHR